MKNELCYGLDGQENLNGDPDETICYMLEAVEADGGWESAADTITWPVTVHVFRRKKLDPDEVRATIELKLCDALQDLDDEYGDMTGDVLNEPTPRMRKAADSLARAIVAGYRVWACEPTGETVVYSREMALKAVGALS